jgi:hypothetical protein
LINDYKTRTLSQVSSPEMSSLRISTSFLISLRTLGIEPLTKRQKRGKQGVKARQGFKQRVRETQGRVMSKDDEQRVFSVAPEGVASIETAEVISESPKLPPLPPAKSPDEVVFLTHILSLKTAALIHLGVIAEVGESIELETAKQIIDTLIVLEKRTQGHLSYEEARLLDASIRELKMAYIAAQK